MRYWHKKVISPRTLLRLLPIVAALLLLAASPLGVSPPLHGESVLASGEQGAQPPRRGDFITRKHRHAASLEEFFAIDDDSEQHFNSLPRGLAPALARYAVFVEPRAVSRYREWRPSYRPSAAFPTGPPSA
jgi:hypothetical protein